MAKIIQDRIQLSVFNRLKVIFWLHSSLNARVVYLTVFTSPSLLTGLLRLAVVIESYQEFSQPVIGPCVSKFIFPPLLFSCDRLLNTLLCRNVFNLHCAPGTWKLYIRLVAPVCYDNKRGPIFWMNIYITTNWLRFGERLQNPIIHSNMSRHHRYLSSHID